MANDKDRDDGPSDEVATFIELDRRHRAAMQQELEVLRRFDTLGVRLQCAVQDVHDEAFAVRDEHDQPTMAVPMDVWEEMTVALKAIHHAAIDLAFGKPQAQSQPPECSICRSRHGKEIQHACE